MVKFFRATFLWILLLPIAVTYTGAGLNQLVLFANGDKFPVMMNAKVLAQIAAAQAEDDDNPSSLEDDGMIDQTHCVMTAQTHLNFLADVFDFHTGWYSVGDGLIFLGEWLGRFCMFVWLAIVVLKLRAYETLHQDS